jgi:threonine dehydrogenase-like Zn-dependent dehydrogenase
VRQLTYLEPGQVAWTEAPDPEVALTTDAIVRPLAVARCDLDASMAAFGIFPGPFPVGHETVAEVVAVGDEVTAHRPGDRVVVPFQVSCGACPPCLDHRFGGCTPCKAKAGAAFGFGQAGGGHGGAVADLLAVPAADHLLIAAPEGLPDVLLCTLPDNVVDGYRTVALPLAQHPGADVLVVGGTAASIGLYAVAAARALDAGSVRYVDADPERLAAAEALGAEALEHDGPWPHHFDRALITVDNTGDAEGLTSVLRSTDAYGFCTSVVIHFTPTTPVPLLEMYTRGVTFHVSRADSRRLLPEVLDLVARGAIDLAPVPTTEVAWDDAADAWLAPATKLILTR